MTPAGSIDMHADQYAFGLRLAPVIGQMRRAQAPLPRLDLNRFGVRSLCEHGVLAPNAKLYALRWNRSSLAGLPIGTDPRSARPQPGAPQQSRAAFSPRLVYGRALRDVKFTATYVGDGSVAAQRRLDLPAGKLAAKLAGSTAGDWVNPDSATDVRERLLTTVWSSSLVPPA
jgi:hypothetical protein